MIRSALVGLELQGNELGGFVYFRRSTRAGSLRRAVVERWLGVDFSGNHLKWRPGCTTSNVWVADVRSDAEGLRLHDLRRVQQLPGAGHPFDRLVALLAAGSYVAAGIDAPFSVPDQFVRPCGGHAAVLGLVAGGQITGRPFVTGDDMVRRVVGRAPPLTPPKPMRATDALWASRGVNVRSPMWTGARPGAPMTAASLTVLHRTARPIWPWSTTPAGLLVEAFPAAQLKTWGVPHQRYDGRSSVGLQTRKDILKGLNARLGTGSWGQTLLDSADALDAVVCAFAAIAVSTSKIALPCTSQSATEGWVAVHR